MTGWTVTTTNYKTERHWGARFEWIGNWVVFAISLNPTAPAMKLVLLGCSFYCGRIPAKPSVQVVTKTFPGSDYTSVALEGK